MSSNGTYNNRKRWFQMINRFKYPFNVIAFCLDVYTPDDMIQVIPENLIFDVRDADNIKDFVSKVFLSPLSENGFLISDERLINTNVDTSSFISHHDVYMKCFEEIFINNNTKDAKLADVKNSIFDKYSITYPIITRFLEDIRTSFIKLLNNYYYDTIDGEVVSYESSLFIEIRTSFTGPNNSGNSNSLNKKIEFLNNELDNALKNNKDLMKELDMVNNRLDRMISEKNQEIAKKDKEIYNLRQKLSDTKVKLDHSNKQLDAYINATKKKGIIGTILSFFKRRKK